MNNEEENKDLTTLDELQTAMNVSLRILNRIEASRVGTTNIANQGRAFFTNARSWLSTIRDKAYRDKHEQDLIMFLATVQQTILVADAISDNSKFFVREYKSAIKNTIRQSEQVMSRFYGKHREKAKNSDCFVINDELQNVIDIYEKAVKTAFSLEHKSEEQQKAFVAEWCDLIDKYGL